MKDPIRFGPFNQHTLSAGRHQAHCLIPSNPKIKQELATNEGIYWMWKSKE